MVHLTQILNHKMTANMDRPDEEDPENQNNGRQPKKYQCLISWLTVCTGERRASILTTILALSFGLGVYFSSLLSIPSAGLKKTSSTICKRRGSDKTEIRGVSSTARVCKSNGTKQKSQTWKTCCAPIDVCRQSSTHGTGIHGRHGHQAKEGQP